MDDYQTRFQLPGFNLPLNWVPTSRFARKYLGRGAANSNLPDFLVGTGSDLFPSALEEYEHETARLLPLRELTMLHVMDAITDKPEWHIKVFDNTISEKWKQEAMTAEGSDVTQAMADWIIEELRYKTDLFREIPTITVYDIGVVKSDTIVPVATKEALKAAAVRLENVPAVPKDWHPGSDGKVLDLVHPSLFPLVYGRSRILTDSLTELDNCVDYCGSGEVIKLKPEEGKKSRWTMETFYSQNFQWLPSEVELPENKKPRFTSYINNLHPQKFKGLYSVIEDVIDHALPLWNETLTATKNLRDLIVRIPYTDAEYEEFPEEGRPVQRRDENEDDFWERTWEWENSVRVAIQPEPETFELPEPFPEETTVHLRRQYGQRGLQVIVKLANIELTPEKPSYEGGTWHVEGQLNEHICATALYYYDCENITSSRLAFRHMVDGREIEEEVSYEQNVHNFMPDVFGVAANGPAVQELGSVGCLEGRLLTFPNILQHRVLPFNLADPTKPGHRKILALFLVDPNIRIISTANVPPQRLDWWSERVRQDFERNGGGGMLAKLSEELKTEVFKNVDDFPISMDEAKEIRLRLMEERKNHVVEQVNDFERVEFSLCEH